MTGKQSRQAAANSQVWERQERKEQTAELKTDREGSGIVRYGESESNLQGNQSQESKRKDGQIK